MKTLQTVIKIPILFHIKIVKQSEFNVIRIFLSIFMKILEKIYLFGAFEKMLFEEIFVPLQNWQAIYSIDFGSF